MMAANPRFAGWTEEEYLARESVAESKSEYVDGSIVAMAGGSLEHLQLISNITQAVGPKIRSQGCRVLPNDMLVRPLSKRYYYPDVVIVCGTPRREKHNGIDVVLNPTIVVEVLSPSTEARDRREKRLAYMQSETIQEILFVAQDAPYIEQLRRIADDQWVLDTVTGLDGIITLSAVDATVSLRAIYDLVIDEDSTV